MLEAVGCWSVEVKDLLLIVEKSNQGSVQVFKFEGDQGKIYDLLEPVYYWYPRNDKE